MDTQQQGNFNRRDLLKLGGRDQERHEVADIVRRQSERRDRGSRGIALFSLRRHGDDGVSRRSGGANDQRLELVGTVVAFVDLEFAITRNRIIA